MDFSPHVRNLITICPIIGSNLNVIFIVLQVAKLFENQEDLLQEFGQFLPDATNNSAAQAAVSDFMDQYRTHHGVSLMATSFSGSYGYQKKE